MNSFRFGTTAFALAAILAGSAPRASADVITFGVGDYDNTANEVTTGLTGPLTTNNQTTGSFRDDIWWSINNAQPRVGSPDFISSGLNLMTCGTAPASACDNGTGSYTSLNFTGPAINGGQSYLSMYDTIPDDGLATNLFDASAPGGLTVTADVWFALNSHVGAAGVVTMYSGGQDGLALLLGNGGGNNPDVQRLSLVYQSIGTSTQTGGGPGILLTSISLPGLTTVLAQNWYQLSLNVQVDQAGIVTAVGTIHSHLDGSNPNSTLLNQIASLNFTGSLYDPDAGSLLHNPLVLTNPGEVGLMAWTNNVGTGCAPTYAGGGYDNTLPKSPTNPCNDNVGASITNFTVPGRTVPEPGTTLLLGLGLAAIARAHRRRMKR